MPDVMNCMQLQMRHDDDVDADDGIDDDNSTSTASGLK